MPTLRLSQPPRGYRYAVDSLLLALFAGASQSRVCLDLREARASRPGVLVEPPWVLSEG